MVKAPQAFLVSRWEQGTAFPSPNYRQKLCAIFGKNPNALGLIKGERLPVPATSLSSCYDPAIPPSSPLPLVGRDDLLARIKQLLYANEGAVSIALNGLPGVGKTSLAIALVNDPAIQKHFCNGILWSGLGSKPDVLELLSRWGNFLRIRDSEANDNVTWARALRRTIGMRRMLLIIDDVWTIEAALAFIVGGPNCSYVLTTRLSDVAIRFAGKNTIPVPELSTDDGVTLLTRITPAGINITEANALVQAVGGLPLALTLIGNDLLIQARYHQQRRLRTALARLHNPEQRLTLKQSQRGIEYYPGLPDGSPLSLQAIIGRSEEVLDNLSRQTLRALSIFPPKPNTFSEAAALFVAATTTEPLDQLIDTGLLECHETNRYTLHQTIADYARTQECDSHACERMVQYFVEYIETHGRDSQLCEQEIRNVLTALQIAYERGMQALFIRGIHALTPLLQTRGLHDI